MVRQPSPARRRAIPLFAGLLIPLIFVVLLELLGNATKALAITEGIPLLWVIGYAVWRRRIEPVGATAVVGFGVALLLTIALGGSPLPLELHRALFPGAVGLACLISLAAGRPLLEIAKSKVPRERSQATARGRPQLEATDAHHALTVLTAIIGVTMTADAVAQVTLALTVSTATFGVVAHIASWVIIGAGLAVCGLFLRSTVRREREREHERARRRGPESTSSTEPTSPLSDPTKMPR
ncbi:MAG: VC0807 family protein [Solirubrobacteraceae bacterium]